uniref:Uncharacterized protein n=1 Tax=Gasterosteus aculeatus TaxID=69293 RepID=G3NY04_GASAC
MTFVANSFNNQVLLILLLQPYSPFYVCGYLTSSFLCSSLLSFISLHSCGNWDAASHCRGNFLFGHVFLRSLLKMIVSLRWKGHQSGAG